jgi:hypothetical protein
MVSSALDMTDEELLGTLRRLRETYASDSEYADLRSALPADWPI